MTSRRSAGHARGPPPHPEAGPVPSCRLPPASVAKRTVCRAGADAAELTLALPRRPPPSPGDSPVSYLSPDSDQTCHNRQDRARASDLTRGTPAGRLLQVSATPPSAHPALRSDRPVWSGPAAAAAVGRGRAAPAGRRPPSGAESDAEPARVVRRLRPARRHSVLSRRPGGTRVCLQRDAG